MIVYDSTGKHQDGFLRGNGHLMGNFDECLDVRASGSLDFSGQYCTAFWLPYIVQDGNTGTDFHQRSLLTILTVLGHLVNLSAVPTYLEPNLYTSQLPSIGKQPAVIDFMKMTVLIFHLIQCQFTAYCLPSSCSPEEFKMAFAEQVGSHLLANYSIVTVTNDQYCFTKEKRAKPLDAADITVM